MPTPGAGDTSRVRAALCKHWLGLENVGVGSSRRGSADEGSGIVTAAKKKDHEGLNLGKKGVKLEGKSLRIRGISDLV